MLLRVLQLCIKVYIFWWAACTVHCWNFFFLKDAIVSHVLHAYEECAMRLSRTQQCSRDWQCAKLAIGNNHIIQYSAKGNPEKHNVRRTLRKLINASVEHLYFYICTNLCLRDLKLSCLEFWLYLWELSWFGGATTIGKIAPASYIQPPLPWNCSHSAPEQTQSRVR